MMNNKRKIWEPTTASGSASLLRRYFSDVFERCTGAESQLPQDEIAVMAERMVTLGGCREASALWIASKFLGAQDDVPRAQYFAWAAGVKMRDLVRMEAEDLKTIRWDLMLYFIPTPE
jgi:hypothetical protein